MTVGTRIRQLRERLAARRRDRRATRGERALARADARAQHRRHESFDEHRQGPGSAGR